MLSVTMRARIETQATKKRRILGCYAIRAPLKTSFLKILPDGSISALFIILMNVFKSDCDCLDLKNLNAFFSEIMLPEEPLTTSFFS